MGDVSFCSGRSSPIAGIPCGPSWSSLAVCPLQRGRCPLGRAPAVTLVSSPLLRPSAVVCFTLHCCSVAKSCPTLCNPMGCSTPGLPVPHHLQEFAQVHVYCISDAIQPSHPLMPSSPLPSIFPSIRDFSSDSSVRIR